METQNLIRPDNRNRIALTGYIDSDKYYEVVLNNHGVVTLTPVMATLSAEQLEDLKKNPKGFVELLERAEQSNRGEVKTVPIENIFE